MEETQAICVDPEPTASTQDFATMTGPVVICSDIHGAKLGKKVTEQISDLHKGGYAHDGPPEMNEEELPCKIDIEPPSDGPGISSVDSNAAITAEDATVQHSCPVDGVDLLHGLPQSSSRSHVEDDEYLEKTLEGKESLEAIESSKLLQVEDHPEQECPICTELYDTTQHKQSLLNCNHVFCDNCIKSMVNTANRANLCRVTCPLCRQTTPMVEWEVRKMQEQMMDSGGVCVQQDYVAPQPLVRRRGLCGALEYRFHKRLRTGRLLFPPCLRNPQRLMERLARLERRCRCLYLIALVFLLFAEFFCFIFLFLPILVFILMIVLGK
ncbi:hypothetical protein GDO81_020981 [Engystomops pustulosus]|uniref:E3 ubiquitin-protein ligase RNF182 n=1 Tax=Engystomops pustulosus TaxID=76066 RepID=A0AAV6ZKA7_ENGPU|nr:hypothetical protein GDO81_020981 [Engystomops pustulosus]